MRMRAYRRPRGHEGAPTGAPYGFRELRFIYPRHLARAFALAVALHLSAIGIGSVALSLRPHPGPAGGQSAPDDTIRVRIMPVPPPIIPEALASPGDIQQTVPPEVKGAMPVPVPDLQVPDRATIPTPDQWAVLFPPGPPGDGVGPAETLVIPGLEEEYPEPGAFVPVEEMPVLVSMPRVEYPAIAREAGAAGAVLVHALVDRDGTVREARVERGVHPLLDEAARRAVSGAMFKPAIQAGRAVPVWAAVPVVFRLN